MKKISLNSVKSYLTRDEMREVQGGLRAFASCAALCIGPDGEDVAMLCMGSTCSALDYVGCTSNNEIHWCGAYNPNA